jgi:hypothetical protein
MDPGEESVPAFPPNPQLRSSIERYEMHIIDDTFFSIVFLNFIK